MDEIVGGGSTIRRQYMLGGIEMGRSMDGQVETSVVLILRLK